MPTWTRAPGTHCPVWPWATSRSSARRSSCARPRRRNSGLDARTFGLVKIAALVALDAPPASYLWQVSNALDAGARPAEILGVLRAVAPQVGGPRVVAAAPEIMVALGLALPEGDV